MRVLHTFKLYRPAAGGVISVMRDLVEAAPADVHSRVLACRSDGPARITVGRAEVFRCLAPLEILSLPLAPSYPFRHFSMARDSDVVASHSPYPLGELTCAAAARWLPPYVVHWHSEVIEQQRMAKLLGPLTRRYLDGAAAILVSTPGHIEISPWLRRYREKCHVVPFGIRPSTVAATRPAGIPAGWPERFGLFLGRLVPYKGLSVLLDAASADGAPPLLVAGGGPMDAMLRDAIQRRGLEGRIRLLGEVSEQEKAWLLHNARFLVLPSTGANETFGIVQLEAMAAALPVINTDAHPGIGWVARDGSEALTVQSGDPVALRDAMQRLVSDDAMAREFGQAGKERVAATFDYDAFVKRVFAIYRDVAAA